VQAGPTDAVVAVTYRCNARCSMCDIWRKGSGRELAPGDYARMPASLRQINVSGGEPLLRDDLAEVIGALERQCPRARIVLSTNGLLPARLRALLEKVRNIAVRVSVDGVGRTHDEIRGTAGAFDKAMESLEIAKAQGIVDVGVCATMSRRNIGAIREVQDLAAGRRVQFTFTVTHSSPVFFGDQSGQEPPPEAALKAMIDVQRRFYGSRRPKDWFKGYFVGGMMTVLQGRPRPMGCRAGIDFFYLDPQGNVYPCHLWDRPMGNILEKTHAEMVAENSAMLSSVGACARRCWMTCTVAPEMRRRLPVFALKVGWGKALHHLRTVSKTDENTPGK